MDEQPQDVARSENFGQHRTGPVFAGERRATPDRPGHMTVKETQLYFAQRGLDRNERTIRRYCTRKDLKCIKVDTDNGQQQHVVDIASADLYVAQQDQVFKTGTVHSGPTASSTQQEPGTPAPARVEPDRPAPMSEGVRQENSVPADDREATELRVKVKELEASNRDLEITNRVKDQVIERLDKDRETFMDRLEVRAHRVGFLEARVLAL